VLFLCPLASGDTALNHITASLHATCADMAPTPLDPAPQRA